MRVFLCEKPSQARDIARELGQPRDLKTYLEAGDDVVAFARGHLFQLAEPEAYKPEWEKWTFGTLPIVPEEFKLVKKKGTDDLVRAINGLLKKADEVVIATDADREGEMIAREILDECRYRGPVRRLWLRALDPESIRKGLAAIKAGRETEPLYNAARARSRADWLVGMNMSRAATIADRADGRRTGIVSIGRVQTPTLALVVRRDREIEGFKSRDYFEVIASVESDGEEFTLSYAPGESDGGRIYDVGEADILAAKASGAKGPLRVVSENKSTPPPKLFALSSLQSAASAKWGFSADKTLAVAQALYETHKLTTYPRTDCSFLPEEQIGDVSHILENIRGVLTTLGNWEPIIRKTVFNSAKITAHHAIIPTKLRYSGGLSSDEAKVYQLICASYAAATMPDYEYHSVSVEMDAAGVVFSSRGNTPLKNGWKAAFSSGKTEEEDSDGDEARLPDLRDGAEAEIVEARVEGKKTKPPSRFTDGTLIEAMKSVARFVSDPAQKARLKETSGIGTEATRAAILKILRDREFIAANGKFLISTEKGRELIAWVEAKVPSLADPGETALWEESLSAIEEGAESLQGFLRRVSDRVGDYVKIAGERISSRTAEAVATGVKCPLSGEDVVTDGERFIFAGVSDQEFPRVFAGREMKASEWAEALVGKTAVLGGFYSRVKKKQFSAAVRWDSEQRKIVFCFDEPLTESAPSSGVLCPKSGDPVRDLGGYYSFPGYPGFRAWKEVAQRKISASEYAEILSGKAGVFKGFKGKTGKPFSARLVFNDQSNRTEFKFE